MLRKATIETENQVYRVDRNVVIMNGVNSDRVDMFISECERNNGVLSITYNGSRRIISVSYNLYVFNSDDLFQMLDKFSVPVRANLIDKIKHSSWQFSDQNQKDILAAPIHCCNKPPK